MMIIKSHVRGGYRAARDYLKKVGDNERVRVVDMSDPDARNLDDAFRNMWTIGSTTRARTPLHHVSINPYKDERLTNVQVLRICARLEERYGYGKGHHQRVVVEHVKDGRQHFHVMWNRVDLESGRLRWPGHHWLKSKQVAREMETELGLRTPPRNFGRRRAGRVYKVGLKRHRQMRCRRRPIPKATASPVTVARLFRSEQQALLAPRRVRVRRWRGDRRPDEAALKPARYGPVGMTIEELIAWAWENQRSDILAQLGIHVSFDL
jgi:hypothetical protein